MGYVKTAEVIEQNAESAMMKPIKHAFDAGIKAKQGIDL